MIYIFYQLYLMQNVFICITRIQWSKLTTGANDSSRVFSVRFIFLVDVGSIRYPENILINEVNRTIHPRHIQWPNGLQRSSCADMHLILNSTSFTKLANYLINSSWILPSTLQIQPCEKNHLFRIYWGVMSAEYTKKEKKIDS